MPKHRNMSWHRWFTDAADSKSYIHLETMDGSVRRGKITGLRYREIEIDGKNCPILEAFELNGDKGDVIEFRNIRRARLA